MEFSYDKVANALYLQFSHEKVKDTEEINDGIILDYGEKDNIIGIEILNYTERNLNLNEIVSLFLIINQNKNRGLIYSAGKKKRRI